MVTSFVFFPRFRGITRTHATVFIYYNIYFILHPSPSFTCVRPRRQVQVYPHPLRINQSFLFLFVQAFAWWNTPRAWCLRRKPSYAFAQRRNGSIGKFTPRMAHSVCNSYTYAEMSSDLGTPFGFHDDDVVCAGERVSLPSILRASERRFRLEKGEKRLRERERGPSFILTFLPSPMTRHLL